MRARARHMTAPHRHVDVFVGPLRLPGKASIAQPPAIHHDSPCRVEDPFASRGVNGAKGP